MNVLFKTVFVVTCGVLTLTATYAMAANENWPKGPNNCKEKGSGFEKDCTLTYKDLTYDPATGAEFVVYETRGTNFSNSLIKKAYTKQGLKAEKKDLNKANKFEGLRDANGNVLLENIYANVIPFSSTHSLVKLKDEITVKIAEHGTHTLIDTPSGYPSLSWISLFDVKTKLNKSIIWLFKHEKDEKIATGGILRPDLTLSPILNNVNPSKSLSNFVKKFAIPTIDLSSGEESYVLFDFHGNVIENDFRIKTFPIASDLHRNGYPIEKIEHKVLQVGEAPRSIGLKDLRLYWPIGSSGELLPRPANIAGVRPLFLNDKGHYESWLIVIKDGDEFDYVIGISDESSRPNKVVAELDKFQRLDDIVIYDEGERINMKPVAGGEAPSHWTVRSIIPNSVNTRFFLVNRVGANTPQDALDARQKEIAGYKVAEASKAKDQIEQDADAAQNAWSNPTRSASSCKTEYDRIFRMMTGGPGSATDDDISWAFQYEKNKGQSCDPWPSAVIAGAPPAETKDSYTLNQGLQDITRAAACTTQTYDCTYIGNGQQSCSWVTRKIC